MSDDETKSKDENPRKRQRVTRACDQCRKRRIKCEAYPNAKLGAPCQICTEAGTADACTFTRQTKKRGPQAGMAKTMTEKVHSLERLVGHLILVHPHIVGLATAFFTDQITTSAEMQSAAYASSGLADLLESHAAVSSPVSKEGVALSSRPTASSHSLDSASPVTLAKKDRPGGAISDQVGSTPSERHELDSPMDMSSLGLMQTSRHPVSPKPPRSGSQEQRQTEMHFDFNAVGSSRYHDSGVASTSSVPLGPESHPTTIPHPQPQPPHFAPFSEPLPVTEPFQAAVNYSDLLGPAAEPGIVLDFASWNQTDLLFSLGLVSHAAHDATTAWLPPPSTEQPAPPSITASVYQAPSSGPQNTTHPPTEHPLSQSASVENPSALSLGGAVPGIERASTTLSTGMTPVTTPGGSEIGGWPGFSQPFPPTDLVDLWMSRGDLGFGVMDQGE